MSYITPGLYLGILTQQKGVCMVDFNGKIANLVASIIKQDNDPTKCDSNKEFLSLAKLLSGTTDEAEQEYIMGVMLEHSAKNPSQPKDSGDTQTPPANGADPSEDAEQPVAPGEPQTLPANGAVPSADAEQPVAPGDTSKAPTSKGAAPVTNPAAGEKEPVNPHIRVNDVKDEDLFWGNWADTENWSREDWYEKLHALIKSLPTYITPFELAGVEPKLHNWLKDIKHMLNNPESNKQIKHVLDEQLKHDWTTSRHDVARWLKTNHLPYIVDETIAERIDNVFGLDKTDVYELVVKPLFDRAKEAVSNLEELSLINCIGYQNFDTSKFDKYRNPLSLSKNMSLEEMQTAINDLAEFVRAADKALVEECDRRFDAAAEEAKQKNEFGKEVNECAEVFSYRLSELAFSLLHNPASLLVTSYREEDGSVEMFIAYSFWNFVLSVNPDGSFKVDLSHSLYLGSVQESDVQEALSDPSLQEYVNKIVGLLQQKIDSGEVKLVPGPERKIDKSGIANLSVSEIESAPVYDANGNLILEKDAGGCYYKYEYDANARLIQKLAYSPDVTYSEVIGDCLYKIERYEYDESGRVIQQVSYYNDGDGEGYAELEDFKIYKYSESGEKNEWNYALW